MCVCKKEKNAGVSTRARIRIREAEPVQSVLLSCSFRKPRNGQLNVVHPALDRFVQAGASLGPQARPALQARKLATAGVGLAAVLAGPAVAGLRPCSGFFYASPLAGRDRR